MTNKMETKAREFWILESRCTGKKSAHKTQLEAWGETQHNDNEFHVIEKSAFDRLLAEAEKVVSAMQRANIVLGDLNYPGPFGSIINNWQAFKKEMGIE